MRYRYVFVAALATAVFMCGCDDDAIQLKKDADEAKYRTDLSGLLIDAQTNRQEKVLEMFEDNCSVTAVFHLNSVPAKGVDIKMEYDAAWLDSYNALHNTSFELFPENLVTLPSDGIVLSPDETVSKKLEIVLKADESIVEDKTYVLPLKAVSLTDGVIIPEKSQHLVYLVKDMRSRGYSYKGDGAVEMVEYMEVNDSNPLNLLQLKIKGTDKLLYDQLVIFSANINLNSEKIPYVYCNPNVQALLDNNESLLQPLRRQGIKVILSILGNHDSAGVAQLSELGAQTFATELANYVYSYNLDGVSFDDEWSLAPGVNPFLDYRSTDAAARLCWWCKMTMPDKIVSFYIQGCMNSNIPAYNGYKPSEFVDYIVGDYGTTPSPVQGATNRNVSGYSVPLAMSSMLAPLEDKSREIKGKGYGYFMTYNLNPLKYSTSLTQLNEISLGLYDREVETPKYYYKKTGEGKYDSTPYPLNLQ